MDLLQWTTKWTSSVRENSAQFVFHLYTKENHRIGGVWHVYQKRRFLLVILHNFIFASLYVYSSGILNSYPFIFSIATVSILLGVDAED